MSGDRLNMTGMWDGTFAYPSYQGPTTPFVANLLDQDGHLGGTTLEPNLHPFLGAAEELRAVLAGNRQGRSVDFTKTYDGEVTDEAIDYVGQLSEDGATVTGVWSNQDLDGTFEMHRERGWEEAVSAEAEESLPAFVTPGAPDAQP